MTVQAVTVTVSSSEEVVGAGSFGKVFALEESRLFEAGRAVYKEFKSSRSSNADRWKVRCA